MLDDQGNLTLFGEDAPFLEEHRRFTEAGCTIHTFILPSGWIGVDTYDYTVVDRLLDGIFREGKAAYVIPRIKLNVPVDWCAKYPAEVLVYQQGPRDEESIRALVGTLRHDYIGYDSELGYYCSNGMKFDRPNVGGVIARQSFSSLQWIRDASEALRRLVEHIEHSPYADRILGYHLAYGASGESMMWGRDSARYSDYGITNRKRFLQWGAQKYGSAEKALEIWAARLAEDGMIELPDPEKREPTGCTPDTFFRNEARDLFALDYDRFVGDINTDALIAFGQVVKGITNKAVGAFYGYFLYMHRCAYTGFLAMQKLLDSDAIDFFAAPKSYYRCLPGEPGNSMCAMLSVNRIKLWIDESDNRTHLCNNGETDMIARNMEETRTVFWREFCKNITQNSSFWWMDLGGGWYDDDEIMAEVKKLCDYSRILTEKAYQSVSEVLVVVDEESMYYSTALSGYHTAATSDTLSNLKLSGVPIDILRQHDMDDPTLDLSGYKLVIFLNPLRMTPEMRDQTLARFAPDAAVMYNYAANIAQDGDMSKSGLVTGFDIRFLPSESSWPLFAIEQTENIHPLALHINDAISIAWKQEGPRKVIMNGTSLLTPEQARTIVELAGCHLYAPSDCAVYADNRVVGVFPRSDVEDGYLSLPTPMAAFDAVSNTDYGITDAVPLPLRAKRAYVFFRK